MTPAQRDEILAIQERYKDLLVQPGDTVVLVDKKELLALLQAGLSRGEHFGFNAGFGKLQPKVKSDGSKTIEFGFTAGFEEHLFADAGGLYGSGVHVTIELNVAPEPLPRPEGAKKDASDPEGLNLPLPFDGVAPEAKDEGAAAMRLRSTCANCGGTCYTGSEDNREPCEACGGTGVVFQDQGPELVPCPNPDCDHGNVLDPEGYKISCPVCHGTERVEVVPEEVAEQEQAAEDEEVHEDPGTDEEPEASEGEPAGAVDPASIF